MATVSQLIEVITRKIDDSSYSDSVIVDFLNDGLEDIAGQVLLPILEKDAVITTVVDENTVTDMPADYDRNIFAASPVNENMPAVRVLNSKGQFTRKYSRLDNVGDVRHIAMHKGTILYQPIPVVVQEITISYYRVPDILASGDDDGLLALPAKFHKMLIDYVCQQIFSEIEDGIEGKKVNTLYHESRYEKFIDDLEIHLREGQSLPDPPVVRGSFL